VATSVMTMAVRRQFGRGPPYLMAAIGGCHCTLKQGHRLVHALRSCRTGWHAHAHRHGHRRAVGMTVLTPHQNLLSMGGHAPAGKHGKASLTGPRCPAGGFDGDGGGPPSDGDDAPPYAGDGGAAAGDLAEPDLAALAAAGAAPPAWAAAAGARAACDAPRQCRHSAGRVQASVCCKRDCAGCRRARCATDLQCSPGRRGMRREAVAC